MARKSRKSANPVWILAGLILIVMAFGGATLLFRQTGEPFRTTELLDAESYLQNARSLRGNVYRIEGEVDNSLALSPTQGRLISISVNGNHVLPVIVPTSFNHINLQKGQRFVFLLEVDEQGMLQTLNLTKS
jgi:hypothetical protein